MDYKKETINTYNENWQQFVDYWNIPDYWEKEISYSLNLVNKKNAKVLDLGCGSGRDLNTFEYKKCQTFGIDLSSKLLEEARRKLNKTILIEASFEKLPFPDNQFDLLWSATSLLHVPKKEISAILDEWQRVLNKDGILFVSVKEGEGEKWIQKRFFSFFKERELEELLGNNFKIIKKERKEVAEEKHTSAYLLFWVTLFPAK